MMAGKMTFSMIKPDTVKARHVGSIINMIEQHGFQIHAMKLTRLTVEDARSFYRVHQERSFFNQMCASMATGPIVAMVLKKENAVSDFRRLIGATDPREAATGTIRAQFGTSIESNAIHGSDADETARTESKFFFPSSISLT